MMTPIAPAFNVQPHNGQLPAVIAHYAKPTFTAAMVSGALVAGAVGVIGGPGAGLIAGASFGTANAILWPLLMKHFEYVRKLSGTTGRLRLVQLMTPTPWLGAVASLILVDGVVTYAHLFDALQSMHSVVFGTMMVLFGMALPLAVVTLYPALTRRVAVVSPDNSLESLNQAVDACLTNGQFEQADQLSQAMLKAAESDVVV